jgi:putative membrane protein
MLLVHPIREVLKFLPVIVVVVLGSTAAGGEEWQLIGVGIPVALGLMRYLTTSFRISGGRIELKRGLLNRHVLSTPVDRVRTVDLTSSPIHRLLGLTKVRIGTGTASTNDEDRIDLDGLPLDRARALRSELLQTSTLDDTVAAADPDVDVVTFDPAWLWFAPLTGSGVVIGAAALGAAGQLLQTVGFWEWFDPDNVDVPGVSLAVLVPLLVLAVLVVISLLSIGGYAVTNWGFRLTRSRGASTWHLTRGLITTRETTLDDDRVAGVNLSEPLGLRLARGARLSAIVTGLSRGQQGSSTLVPPAPRRIVERVAAEVLDAVAPVAAPLLSHGPRAARRRWTRAALPALAVAAGCVVAVAAGAPSWLLAGLLALPVAALLAWDRIRSLGHALVGGHLVARSGSVVRRRRILEVDHVIGWNLRATWFQRRAGVTTLVATMAGGNQAVQLLDVPDDEAVRVAHEALPELVAQFRAG